MWISQISSIQYRKLDFEEFCSAAISVHQLEGMESWEQHARRAYELFEKDGNRPIMIEELASVFSLSLSLSLLDAFRVYWNHVCVGLPPGGPLPPSPYYLEKKSIGVSFFFIDWCKECEIFFSLVLFKFRSQFYFY